ncbi:response regulator transcription factor [Salinicola endophyticus]|uniref:Response regulator transcription factor n=1 Tax=Salinicola endophyticus TaxID=1949083 RepID=A0ABY8FED3_9GAMM|nr:MULTISPECIES: response regulator transcription factor [Salinicola]WFF41178.1 response regulator transcription factor [Salinicola endophyticus]
MSEVSPGPGPRLLVIEDDRQIRRFLRISLCSQGFQVEACETGAAGVAAFNRQPPALVLLDLGLPDVDGMEVLDALRAQSEVPVLVVSARGSEREKVAALDAGANDYVTKPFGIQELLARVRVALRAPAPSAVPALLQLGELTLDIAGHRVTRHGEALHLTPREFSVLAMLARQPDRVVTQHQLLAEIWGPVHVHDTHYLRIVVSRLRHKLGDDPDAPRLIQTEPGVGYRLVAMP